MRAGSQPFRGRFRPWALDSLQEAGPFCFRSGMDGSHRHGLPLTRRRSGMGQT